MNGGLNFFESIPPDNLDLSRYFFLLGGPLLGTVGLNGGLAGMEIGLDVADSALAEIARAGFDPVYGARPLKRAIQASIENPLAKRILEGEFGAKDTVKIAAKGGTILFSKG